MRKYLLATIAIAGIVYLTGCKEGKSGEAITLKFNLAKGARYEYAMNMDMSINQKMMGQDVKMKTTMGFTYLFEITSDSAGWKNMEATFSRINMDMDMGAMSMHFDSDTPPTDTAGPTGMIAKIFGGLKGAKFSFSMNEKGDIKDIKGYKEMIESATKGLPSDAIKSMQGLDENNFRQSIQQSFGAYPDKPVKKGDTWSKNMEMNLGGMTVKYDNNYKLESVNGNNAEVKIDSKISSSGSMSRVPGSEVNMTGTSDGKLIYDIPTGTVTEGTINMKMQMKMKMNGQEMPMNMDVKLSIKGKTK